MDENGKGRINIQAGGNVGFAAGEKSIAAGGDINGGIHQQEEIHYGTIQLNEEYVHKLHKDYSDSLKQFLEQINKQLQAEKIPPQRVAPIQEDLNTVAKELEDVKPDDELLSSKESSIGGKFSAALEGLMDISPQIAETVASCIPILSPFSKPIGKGVETIVEKYRKGKKS